MVISNNKMSDNNNGSFDLKHIWWKWIHPKVFLVKLFTKPPSASSTSLEEEHVPRATADDTQVYSTCFAFCSFVTRLMGMLRLLQDDLSFSLTDDWLVRRLSASGPEASWHFLVVRE